MDTASDTGADTALDLHEVLVVIDFDGAITTGDCMDVVLRRHVAEWPRLVQAASRGTLSDVHALELAVRQLRVPWELVVAEFAEAAELRRDFGGFLDRLRTGAATAAVVSAGVRERIEAVWRREGLPATPLYAAELRGDAEHGFALKLDQRFGDCPLCGPGRCKGAVARSLRRASDFVVAFGDGARHLCMAREADLVFARSKLARLCQREAIPARPFEDFTTAGDELAAWLKAARRGRPRER